MAYDSFKIAPLASLCSLPLSDSSSHCSDTSLPGSACEYMETSVLMYSHSVIEHRGLPS